MALGICAIWLSGPGPDETAPSTHGAVTQQRPIRGPGLFGAANTVFVSPAETVRTVSADLLGQDVWAAFQAYFWDYGHGESVSGAADLFAAVAPGLAGHYPGIGVVTHDFHWKNVIGPLSSRRDPTPRQSSFDTDRMLQFGPEEYGRLVEELRGRTGRAIAGSIQVNVVSGTAEEAADWVEFMNAPNDGSNPGGGTDWAAVRAANGHPAPFGIHYWELGNEPFYTADDIGSLTAWAYVDRIKAFVPAMKARDPSIEVMAYVNPFKIGDPSAVGTAVPDPPAGPSPDGSEPAGLTWSQAVIKHAGALLDLLYLHWYGAWNENRHDAGYVLTTMVTGLVPWLDRLQNDVRAYAPDQAARTRLSRVAVPEWNSYGGFSQPIGTGTAMLGALADSRILHTLVARPEIVLAARLALAAPYPDPPLGLPPLFDIRSGYFGIWTEPDVATYVKTPVYLMGTIWARAFEPRAVRADVQGLPQQGSTRLADVTALASDDSSRVNVIVTNASARAITLSCNFARYAIQGSPTLLLLRGASLQDANSYSEPNRVTVEERTVTPASAGQVQLDVPAYAVAALLVRGSPQS